jgi:hypothetical protein
MWLLLPKIEAVFALVCSVLTNFSCNIQLNYKPLWHLHKSICVDFRMVFMQRFSNIFIIFNFRVNIQLPKSQKLCRKKLTLIKQNNNNSFIKCFVIKLTTHMFHMFVAYTNWNKDLTTTIHLFDKFPDFDHVYEIREE